MKTIATTAIVALMTAAIGLTAIAPTYAQDVAQQERFQGKGDFRFNNQGPRQGGLEPFSLDRGAEAVEIALVRVSHAIDMTAEQQALFDTLKTDALAAAETFSAAAGGLRPAAPAEGLTAALPDVSASFDERIIIQTAYLAALKAVQPALTAFFDSLTDEQKAQLMPQRPARNGGPGEMGNGGMRHQAPDASTNG